MGFIVILLDGVFYFFVKFFDEIIENVFDWVVKFVEEVKVVVVFGNVFFEKGDCYFCFFYVIFFNNFVEVLD